MTRRRDVQHSPRVLSLKVASRELVGAAGGGDGAGATCGTRQQRVSDCVNPNTDDFLRLDEVACLEAVTAHAAGAPIVTRQLARLAGYTLVKNPDASPGRGDLLRLVASQSKEGGAIAAGVCEALSDTSPGGAQVTRAEARALRGEVWRLIETAVAMDATLAAIEAGEHEG